MSGLLRRVSHHDFKKVTTLSRSKTYESDLTKLDKILPRQATVASFGHREDFDYKRDTKYLCKILKHCTTAHTLDLDFILHFLSSYTCEQRLILVRDLEFEYEYNLVDMVLERPESPMRSCTLAMLIEPIELYVRDFHDLLTYKQLNKVDYDISRKLLEILLPLSNEDMKKFKETYVTLFESTVETDMDIVLGAESMVTNLFRHMLEGKRFEEPGHSATLAKTIARRLYEAGEGTPGIDYDTFIKIFTRDTFPQLSAIFDEYEDRYGRPIQEAIQREFQGQIETECFQDMVEYVRSPSGYFSRILRQALDHNPVDYVTLSRIIIGHYDKDLGEIELEYSKVYDEPIENIIKNRVDVLEIKRLFILIITHGVDITATETDRVYFDHSGAASPTHTTSTNTGLRRNLSQEAFDLVANVFKPKKLH